MDYMHFAIEYLKSHNSNTAEIPVCAVIVKDDEILAFETNHKEEKQDVTSHAEIEAIKIAQQKLKSWHLEDCEMYVTLEPCPMCAWAIIQARIKTVCFGSFDMNYGALGSKLDLRQLANSKLKVYGGILQNECDEILSSYFSTIRLK